MNADAIRWAWATLALLLWLSLWAVPWRQRRRSRFAPVGQAGAAPPMLIAFASQSGESAQWAQRTARLLAAQGVPLRLLPLDRVQATDLADTTRLLLIASTTGEGDAPDNAAAFQARLMRAPRTLPALRYGLLARGDRSYARFCAFGLRLDDWLRASGATPAFGRIDADGEDPAAWARWLREAARLADATQIEAQPEQAVAPALSPLQRWRLLQRHVLNAGSPGAPVHHIVLQMLEPDSHWEAGDVARIHLPATQDQPATWREYSLASLPTDGRAEFLVREVQRPDGRAGRGSGWLCHQLALGQTLQLQLRRNPGFHAPAGERPLLLIGNGTGLAGLVAHLKAREQARQAGQTVGPAWLMLGERSAATDRHWEARLQVWRSQGLLQRLDRAFSRDAHAPARYVQDLIAPQAALLRQWVAQGAAIYVCGQRTGMAQGVDAALGQALGRDSLDALQQAGRYRRDVY